MRVGNDYRQNVRDRGMITDRMCGAGRVGGYTQYATSFTLFKRLYP